MFILFSVFYSLETILYDCLNGRRRKHRFKPLSGMAIIFNIQLTPTTRVKCFRIRLVIFQPERIKFTLIEIEESFVYFGEGKTLEAKAKPSTPLYRYIYCLLAAHKSLALFMHATLLLQFNI